MNGFKHVDGAPINVVRDRLAYLIGKASIEEISNKTYINQSELEKILEDESIETVPQGTYNRIMVHYGTEKAKEAVGKKRKLDLYKKELAKKEIENMRTQEAERQKSKCNSKKLEVGRHYTINKISATKSGKTIRTELIKGTVVKEYRNLYLIRCEGYSTTISKYDLHIAEYEIIKS